MACDAIGWRLVLTFASLFLETLCQNKGDRFKRLQTGELFNTVIASTDPTEQMPSAMIVGGWFKWLRCDYASFAASHTGTQTVRVEPNGSWVPFYATQFSNTQRQVFNCSMWQHIAVVFTVNPTTGGITSSEVYHKPRLRRPLNLEENRTVALNLNGVDFEAEGTQLRFATFADLIQHGLFWWLDYPSADIPSEQRLAAAYSNLIAGQSSPFAWTLSTERLFDLVPPLKVNGTNVYGNMLTHFVNDDDPVSRPGLSLRWNTTYEFPDLVQLPEVNGEYAIEPCLTLVLSFRLQTKFSRRIQKVSLTLNIQKGQASLLRDFRLELNFGTRGGKQNGTTFSIDPILGPYQNLTSVVSVCRFADFWSMRHSLFRDKTKVVASVATFLQSDYFRYSNEKLDTVLSVASNESGGNRLFLRSLTVAKGAADTSDFRLTKAKPSVGCLAASAVFVSGGEVRPFCLVCDADHFLNNGLCVAQNAADLRKNATCDSWAALGSCATCASGYRADLYRYACTPVSHSCESPKFTLDSVNQICSDRTFTTACSLFQYRDATGVCKCRVDACQTCLYSPCEACSGTNKLIVDGTQVKCEPLTSGYGKSAYLGLTDSIVSYQPCAVKDCQICGSHSNICATCSLPTSCKIFVASCHNSCSRCRGPSATDCISCPIRRIPKPSSSSCVTASECSSSGAFYVTPKENSCEPCNSTCASCRGPNANDCLSCSGGAFLQETGGCGSCPDEKYFDDGSRCLRCHSSCKTCDDDGCLSCFDGFYLENQSCKIYCSQSPGTTLVGQFSEYADPGKPFSSKPGGVCDSPAGLSSGSVFWDPSTNQFKATYLKTGPIRYRLIGITQCKNNSNCNFDKSNLVDGGPVVWFGAIPCGTWDMGCNVTILNSSPTVMCDRAHTPCTGFTTTSLTVEDQTITVVCPELACQASCPENCKNCTSGGTQCLACNSPHVLSAVNGTCDSCGAGYTESNELCVSCHASCTTCSGPQANKCTSCPLGSYLEGSSPAYCIPCTRRGQMVQQTPLMCKNCTGDCLECSGESTKCTKCASDKFLRLDLHTCVDATGCPPGTLALDGVCRLCDPNCAACGPLSASTCSACAPDSLFSPATLSCLSLSETQQHYTTRSAGQSAHRCSPNCRSCAAAADRCDACDSARDLLLHEDSSCDFCPAAGYLRQTQKCVRCRGDCLECGPEAHICKSCVPGMYFSEHNKTCGPCQQPGFYREVALTNPRCLPCQSTCSDCGNGDSCFACISGLYLYKNATCGQCSEVNMVIVGEACVLCHESCLRCKDATRRGCTKCSEQRFLTPKGICEIKQLIMLESSVWYADLKEGIFSFSEFIEAKNGTINQAFEVSIYSNPVSRIKEVTEKAENLSDLTEIGNNLQSSVGWTYLQTEISGKRLKIKFEFSKTITAGTLVLRSKALLALQSTKDANKMYPERFLILPNINIVITALDSSIDAAASTVSTSVTAATSFLFIVSIPQAFILMKVFQTIDFYIYIDCEYPTNFSKMLEIFSQNLMDYVPNLLEPLADEEGVPVYPRFEKFGLSIHVFKNLGRHFTFFSCVGLFKLLVMGLSRLLPKVKLFSKLDSSLDKEMALTMMEGLHLDIILSIMIHIGNRNQINNTGLNSKYFAIVFISVVSLGLVGIYIYMAYTVSRITKAYYQYGLLQVKDMRNEPLRGLLKGKQMGRLFQRHFNLVVLFRDIFICSLLLVFYQRAVILLSFLTAFQAVFFAAVLCYPPYSAKSDNRLLWISQGMYLILDILFLINSAQQMTAVHRYYYLGVSMILVVSIIILANSGTSLYSNIRDLWNRFRRWRKKISQSKLVSSNKTTKALQQHQDDLSESSTNKQAELVSTNKPSSSIPSIFHMDPKTTKSRICCKKQSQSGSELLEGSQDNSPSKHRLKEELGSTRKSSPPVDKRGASSPSTAPKKYRLIRNRTKKMLVPDTQKPPLLQKTPRWNMLQQNSSSEHSATKAEVAAAGSP